MSRTADQQYEEDPVDGFRRQIVGSWSPLKHKLLQYYVDVTRATRRDYNTRSEAAYIDLYCGTGRCKIRDSEEAVDGSPLVAVLEAGKRDHFSSAHIGDTSLENLAACEARLRSAGVTRLHAYHGAAEQTAAQVVKNIHPYGLHLAFLDPYNLQALPFSVIEILAQCKRMDLIIHVSLMDLNRNFARLAASGKLDAFAPGWQKHVDLAQRGDLARRSFFEHWKNLLAALNYEVSPNVERISGNRNQPLYWLVCAGKHELVTRLWGKISNVEPQGRLSLKVRT